MSILQTLWFSKEWTIFNLILLLTKSPLTGLSLLWSYFRQRTKINTICVLKSGTMIYSQVRFPYTLNWVPVLDIFHNHMIDYTQGLILVINILIITVVSLITFAFNTMIHNCIMFPTFHYNIHARGQSSEKIVLTWITRFTYLYLIFGRDDFMGGVG